MQVGDENVAPPEALAPAKAPLSVRELPASRTVLAVIGQRRESVSSLKVRPSLLHRWKCPRTGVFWRVLQWSPTAHSSFFAF